MKKFARTENAPGRVAKQEINRAETKGSKKPSARPRGKGLFVVVKGCSFFLSPHRGNW